MSFNNKKASGLLHEAQRVAVYLSLLTGLLQPVTTVATEDYINIEKRKERIDQLQDLLQIREAELQLQKMALEKESLHHKRKEIPATRAHEVRDSTATEPPQAAPPKNLVPEALLDKHGRLVEIFDDLAIVELNTRRYSLRRGNTLQGWRVHALGTDFIRLQRAGHTLEMHLDLPAYKKPTTHPANTK